MSEVSEDKIKAVASVLDGIAKGSKPFEMTIKDIGAFPKIDYLRVIWLGIENGEAETKKIAKGLEERIEKIGIPKEERAFSSHITIGRTRSTLNRESLIRELKNKQQDFSKEELGFAVSKITLFKSTLSPKGPIYEVLKETNLKTI